jgi:hypothetical protein
LYALYRRENYAVALIEENGEKERAGNRAFGPTTQKERAQRKLLLGGGGLPNLYLHQTFCGYKIRQDEISNSDDVQYNIVT